MSVLLNMLGLTPAAMARMRLDLCKACTRYKHGRCLECGCIVLLKTKIAGDHCPLQKW